jgi:hypothetical protein
MMWRWVLFLVVFFETTTPVFAQGVVAEIARWYQGRRAAVTLRFDDAFPSHVEYVIPKLNHYGIPATFMVNPGRTGYLAHREFWEEKVVPMGHRLGNHTMHHRGAASLQIAQYEIQEAAKILRPSQPGESDLMVFAAGGNTKWGGEIWEKSSPAYKAIPQGNALIDLYDGLHTANKTVYPTDSVDDLCKRVEGAIARESHQSFAFHDIGRPGLIDLAKRIFFGYHLTYPENGLTELLECIHGVREQLWLAPLVSVYKYEAERDRASLNVKENTSGRLRLVLTVGTDPSLYDHKLTLRIRRGDRKIKQVFQETNPLPVVEAGNGVILVDVEPKQSEITVFFQRSGRRHEMTTKNAR